ncbi:MAG: hypothetical protein QXS02_04860 [Candidatus Thermoplasmatota archaeon]
MKTIMVFVCIFLLFSLSFSTVAYKPISYEDDSSFRLILRAFICGTASDLRQNNSVLSLTGRSLFLLTSMRSPVGGFFMWSLYNKGQIYL